MANHESRIRELERQVWWFRFWFGLGAVMVAGAAVAVFVRMKG